MEKGHTDEQAEELYKILKNNQDKSAEKAIHREREINKLEKKANRSEQKRYYNHKFKFLKEGASEEDASKMAEQSIVAEDYGYTDLILDQRQREAKDCFCTIM